MTFFLTVDRLEKTQLINFIGGHLAGDKVEKWVAGQRLARSNQMAANLVKALLLQMPDGIGHVDAGQLYVARGQHTIALIEHALFSEQHGAADVGEGRVRQAERDDGRHHDAPVRPGPAAGARVRHLRLEKAFELAG